MKAWSEKWGALNTDGNITWAPDPSLTPLGITQAQKVHAAWVKEAAAGAPIGADEMKWYCSPMVRTGETLLHTWGDLLAGRPEVWEDWRELLGKHPCNRRNPRVGLGSTKRIRSLMAYRACSRRASRALISSQTCRKQIFGGKQESASRSFKCKTACSG